MHLRLHTATTLRPDRAIVHLAIVALLTPVVLAAPAVLVIERLLSAVRARRRAPLAPVTRLTASPTEQGIEIVGHRAA